MMQKCSKCGKWNSAQYCSQPALGRFIDKHIFGTDGGVAIFECSCGNTWDETIISNDQTKLYEKECRLSGKQLSVVHSNKRFEVEPLFNDEAKEKLAHYGEKLTHYGGHLLFHLLKG